MLLGLYSDPHISYTSSIFPLTSATKYTRRLEMIINSYEWMYNTFHDLNVDCICNCGDTFDSHVVRAEEITALTECLSYSYKTPEIWITGNHEIFNNEFWSNSFVKNYNFIELYDKQCKVNDVISVIPYIKASDIDPKSLSSISNKVLLSHIDIKGSHLRPDFIDDSGFDPEYLAMNFEASFNGHIHTAETIKTSSNLVKNIGSIVSHSFSDNNSYIPSICTYDTETKVFNRYLNPNAILFRKFKVNSMTELLKVLDKYTKSGYLYILRITCPFELREEVCTKVSIHKCVVSSRITTTIDDSSKLIGSQQYSVIDSINFNNSSIKSKFLDFLNDNNDILKYPKNYYDKILQEIDKE